VFSNAFFSSKYVQQSNDEFMQLQIYEVMTRKHCKATNRAIYAMAHSNIQEKRQAQGKRTIRMNNTLCSAIYDWKMKACPVDIGHTI
jgi:hypothetical protein